VLLSQHRGDHLGRLRDAGIDVEGAQMTRQLEVALPEDTYLRTGRFNKDAMLALIKEALKAGNALSAHPDDRACRNGGQRLEERQRKGRIRDAAQ
jgi:hypothetical protein